MEFKEKLKKLRAQRGISQQALADAIFVSRSALANWENGLGLPSDASYEALTSYARGQLRGGARDRRDDRKRQGKPIKHTHRKRSEVVV